LEIEKCVNVNLPESKTECRFCNHNFINVNKLNCHFKICKERENYHKNLKERSIETINNENIGTLNNGTIGTNNNGTINFGRAINTYLPSGLSSGLQGTAIISLFWCDLDTSQSRTVGGTGFGTNLVYYGSNGTSWRPREWCNSPGTPTPA
jgi:hypothetical protein